MRPYTPWQEPGEGFHLHNGKWVNILYYEDVEKGIASDRFHAKYREIRLYEKKDGKLLGSRVEENPFHDPQFFESLQKYQEEGLRKIAARNKNSDIHYF